MSVSNQTRLSSHLPLMGRNRRENQMAVWNCSKIHDTLMNGSEIPMRQIFFPFSFFSDYTCLRRLPIYCIWYIPMQRERKKKISSLDGRQGRFHWSRMSCNPSERNRIHLQVCVPPPPFLLAIAALFCFCFFLFLPPTKSSNSFGS